MLIHDETLNEQEIGINFLNMIKESRGKKQPTANIIINGERLIGLSRNLEQVKDIYSHC